MNRIIMFIKGLDRKVLLLAVGGLLLVLNLGRMAWDAYGNQLDEAEAQLALLGQYQQTVKKLPNIKKKVARQKQRAARLKKFLFTGSSEEEVSSAMQIMLQERVTKAGLEPESIRPLIKGGQKNAPQDFNEIEVKIRLAGNLSQLIDFLAQLYRSDKLFQIESFTLKPYKNTEMKIFLDLKGFYSLKNV
ncbi:MAG: hypothetical protein KQH63_06650 [Desulfobulbaceae bacterium]|nr:hypothetical protein [Desulfobulbaceae bacterium]